jgi:hypothetical protein
MRAIEQRAVILRYGWKRMSRAISNTSARLPLTERSGQLIALIYIAASLLAVLPILAVEIPPLVDYPNHLARMHVLAGYDSSPLLQHNYLIEWLPIPNLAMDGVVTLLTVFFSPMAASRIFLALTIFLTAGGIVTLHRVLFGRLGLWPLASFAVAYSLPFVWGFVNFQFSVGLALLCCAAWIASDRWHPAIRIAVFNFAASAVYFAHLFGYLALILAIGFYELNRAFQQRGGFSPALFRRFATTALSFAVPAILFLIGVADPEGTIKPLPLGTWYGDVYSKLSALLSAFLFYGGVPDLSLIVVVVTLAAAAMLTGRLLIAPGWALPLAGMLMLTVAVPGVFRGLFLDSRLGFVLGCFFIAATKPVISGQTLRASLHVALVAVLAVKMSAVLQIWQARDREYAEFREALRAVEPGNRLLAVHDTGESPADGALPVSVRWYMAISILPGMSRYLAWRCIDTLAVIDRHAYTPTLFKTPSSQPLRSAPRHRDIDPVAPSRRVSAAMLVAGADIETAETLRREAAERGEVAFWAGWPQRFDNIVVIHLSGVVPARLEGLPLTRLGSGSFFDIYRVNRPD